MSKLIINNTKNSGFNIKVGDKLIKITWNNHPTSKTRILGVQVDCDESCKIDILWEKKRIVMSREQWDSIFNK